ncbi:hypothetical protein TWF281_002420 [Arthrobotrys megalospora]
MHTDESQMNVQSADPHNKRSEHWVLKIMKGRIGAAWFCFANITSFVFILLVFLGNIYPSTTIFAMISIDLHPQFNDTLSLEIYRADNYTGINPLTNRIEQPRYLYLGFSGRCNVYDNNGTNVNQYSKECTKSFLQPLILPNGALQNENGERGDSYMHNINFRQVDQMWETTAAFMILTMIYNVASIVVVCIGKYELAFKYFWIMAILCSIPPAVLALDALSKVYGPLTGVALNKPGAGQCLGLGFFLLAMLLTFVCHPILLGVVIVVVGLCIFIVCWVLLACLSCISGSKTKEEEKEAGELRRQQEEQWRRLQRQQ